MKKIISLVLISSFSITLFAQNKDSLEWAEMRRLNRMGDSIHKAGLAKDSAFRVQMEEALLKTRRGIEESKQKEVEEATQQVVEQQQQEQGQKRKTMVLAIGAFSITILVAVYILKRRKQQRT